MSLRRIVFGIAVCWVLLAESPSALACNFNESAGRITLRQEAVTSFILLGHFENARGTKKDGTTDFVISRALKSDAALVGKKVVTFPQFVSIPDPKNPPRFLVLGDVKDGKIELYKGILETPTLVGYVEGLLKIDAKDRVKLMRYAFDFLEHEEDVISADAFEVFIASTDPDIRKVGQALAPEKLRKWLRAKNTPDSRLRLYAYLLANCGKPEDAILLRRLLDKLVKKTVVPQLDGILTAYTLLDPKAGWAYTCALMKENQDFIVLHSGLRAARYFHNTQPEVLSEADLLRAIKYLLDNPNMADLAIDELRKWKCWKLTDEVLALMKKEGFDVPIIRRSVVKYALLCPGEAAAKIVAEARKADPERVKLLEELVKAESEQSKP
jgi:hypothetical protein